VRARGGASVVVATENAGKLAEISAILSDLPVELCSLSDFDPVDFPEEGGDYAVNAIAKARAVAEELGSVAVADDSGLEVNALDGAPGPYSARYGGVDLSDDARVDHLLENLEGVPASRRAARFVCVAALVTPDGDVLGMRGECLGKILERPRGRSGFGYDPVFQPAGDERSMAELPAEEKNRVSHRGRAFRALFKAWLGPVEYDLTP
jgi:XTP/dITP diphosphohydrolase